MDVEEDAVEPALLAAKARKFDALVTDMRMPGMSGAAYFFEDPETAGDFVRSLAREGDAVLFKGSRGVAVEKAMERLLAGGEA